MALVFIAYAALFTAILWYFTRRSLTTTLPIAAAQDCNEDVLNLIFASCSLPTLAAAGRVCRAWKYPAQRALFASITPKWEPEDIEPRWPQLARSLNHSARLRSYVRYVRVLFTRSADLDHFVWLATLPARGLNTLVVYGNQDARTLQALERLLLSSPAVESVRSLVLSSPIIGDTAQLELYLSSPSLEHLGVIFLDAFATTPLAPKPCGTVRRLSLQSSDLVDDILSVVQACSKTLRRLDLNFTNLRPPSRERLMTMLAGLPQLEHLWLAWGEYRAIPFLDNLCSHLPHLQHLRAGACLYTPAFFSNIPSTLQTLHLGYRSTKAATVAEIIPVDAAVNGLRTRPGLKEFTLQPHAGSAPVEFPELATICSARGIHFSVLQACFRESQLHQ
ncbi:hypothetical protein C8R46DRAFT_1245672 [Mycena filopes]|nr:hypothetical protein C8R46DRAFT_1245672 [Mycena filopes]